MHKSESARENETRIVLKFWDVNLTFINRPDVVVINKKSEVAV